MLKKCRILLCVLVAFVCCWQLSVPATAAENAKEPEVSVQTEKSEYSDGEEIKGTITVNNITENNLQNVTLKFNVPAGYTSKDGKIEDGKWCSTISEVAAGAKTEIAFDFVKLDTSVVPGNKDDVEKKTDVKVDTKVEVDVKQGPKTGDSFPIVKVIVVLAICAGALFFLIKYGKKKNILSAFLALAVVMSFLPVRNVFAAQNQETKLEKKTIEYSKDIVVAGNKTVLKLQLTYYLEKTENKDTLSYEGYNIKWQDEFNGTQLNRDDWNVELHAPKWVNDEWQAYVDSTENIYLKDGKLVIKPIKTVAEDGSVSYTSGRINTQGKHDFTYGLFETRVRVPEGKGYLPAFWLMSSDENLYGQWPRCGEIDAMEVHGSDTKTTYGTIHYGNPHKQTQGTYTLESGSFSDEFHTFAVEWMPGRINWYMDGILYHTANDWYSATEGQGEISYPAPFDQPFYMILNLAVGGSWVGYPDETTDFANQSYEVDYVRVYQKDSYDENVEKPEKNIVFKEPDANGNYITNGDFAVAEDLADDKDWTFLTANGGAGLAKIANNQIAITTSNAGEQDYSIQLVQPNLPMKKGAEYELSFKAWADENRTMKVDISGPDVNYVRYFNDTEVALTTEPQTFKYTFTMGQADDANGRVEFNMGNTTSTAGIKITDVTLKKVKEESVEENNKKQMLTDGNFVYNGKFQEGAGRMLYWDIDNKAGADVSVTGLSDNRRMKIVVPESANGTVTVSQSDMAMVTGAEYALTYDIQGDAGKSMAVAVNGKTTTAALDGSNQKGNTIKFTSESNKNLSFVFLQPGTYFLDNVRIDEDSLIKNGSFNAGFAGYETYADSSASATWVVDSLTEDSAADITIKNTGAQDWMIQLKQNNVELIKDQSYRLSFKAKSNMARKIMVAIQKDGSADNDWIPYSGQKIVDLTSDYQTFELEFTMKNETDLKSILSISMGAVDGTQITTQHRICIDDIKLEKIEKPTVAEKPVGEELINNTDNVGNDGISDENKTWGHVTNGNDVTFNDGTSTWDIKNLGDHDYSVQLSKKGIQLEKGCCYELKFTANSTETRNIKYDFMSTSYAWYAGETIGLSKDMPKNIKFQFKMDEDTDVNTLMTISMGKMDDGETALSTITLSDFSLKKIKKIDAVTPTEPTDPSNPTEPEQPDDQKQNLLNNGDFKENATGWSWYIAPEASLADAATNPIIIDGKAVYDITSVGTADWNIQLKQEGIPLEQGETYTLTFKVKSSVDRTIKVTSMDSASAKWYVVGDPNIVLTAGAEKTVSIQLSTGTNPTDTNAYIQVAMGKVDDKELESHTIELSNFVLTKN